MSSGLASLQQDACNSLTAKCNPPVVLEKKTNVARLPSLTLLPDSRFTQPEDAVVKHVQDGNHANTISRSPHTAKPAACTRQTYCMQKEHRMLGAFVNSCKTAQDAQHQDGEMPHLEKPETLQTLSIRLSD